MKKDTVWHYSLPSIKGEGWAQVFITSRGVFSAVSDWGNYGYVWTNTGYDDVRRFFLNPAGRENYFISKLSSDDSNRVQAMQFVTHVLPRLAERIECQLNSSGVSG